MALSARSRVRARLLNSWIPGRGAAPSAPGGGGSTFDKLIYLSGGQTDHPRKWLDTAVPGDTLATIQDMLIGGSYTARLFTEPNWPQPAADALTIVGNQLRAGAGWSTVYPTTYVLEIENTTTGLVTHQPVHVFSNRAANLTVNSNATLLTALGQARTAVQTGAAFQGFVIDLQPGIDYGSIEFDMGFHASQTRQVILRNADPNRTSPASRPKFQHCTIYNCRFPGWQSLLFEIGNLQLDTFIRTRTYGGLGNNTLVDRPLILNNIFRGGELVFNSNGTSFIDHTQTIDPTNNWHPGYSFFLGIRTYNAGLDQTTFTRADLRVGVDGSTQTGAAYGVWAQASTPAFVGNNTPTGGPGVFGAPGSGTWRGGNWPNDSRPAAPATFDLQFEVAFLDSTPRNTLHGGPNRTKPGPDPATGRPAPDGNYIVAWKMEDTPGRVWPGESAGDNGSLLWTNQRSYYVDGLPTGVLKVPGAEYKNLVMSLNSGSQLNNFLFGYVIGATTESLWTLENFAEMFARDAFGATWSAPGPHTNPHVWPITRGHFHALNFVGRAIIRELDLNNPHGDSDQHFDSNPFASAGGRAYPYKLNIGNFQFTPEGSGRVGAGIQGPFLSDLEDGGYRFVSLGNFIHANEPNSWGVFRLQAEFALHNTVIEVVQSGKDGMALDPNFPGAVSHVNNTWGSLIPPQASTLLFNARYFSGGNVVTAGNSPAVWSAPNFGWTTDIAALKARFTGVGDAAGKGAFGNTDTIIDHLRGTWNPNAWEFRLLQEDLVAQPASTAVRSAPRQLLFGTRPRAVSVSNGQWSKGADPAAAIAAARTSAPGELAPGEWIVLWATTSATAGAIVTPTLTVGGVASSFSVQTAEIFQFPANNNLSNITRTNYASAGAVTSWTPVSGVMVPAGAMAVFLATSNGSTATALDPLDPNWVDIANSTNGTALRSRVFTYFNDTASPVSKSLRLTTASARTFSGVLLIIPRTSPALVLRTAISAPRAIGSTTPFIEPVTLPSARKAWFGALISHRRTDVLAAVSAGPTGYTLRANGYMAPAATTDVGAGVYERFNEVLTEDPDNFTMAPSGTSNTAITWALAVYEDVP